MWIIILALFSFLIPGNGVVNFSSSSDHRELQVLQGKTQYEIIKMESKMPSYGPCWKKALLELDTGCKNLDDDVQSRLALNFANCFLEKAGLRTFPCKKAEPISDCLRNIDNNAFTTYSNFFTHTQNMCHFLQSQVWQEETDLTVQRLVINSDKVGASLKESHQLHREILEGQQKTVEYHRQLLENGSYLSKAIETSKENVREMLNEFRLSTDEQKHLIFEVFDRVSRLQNLVVSEVNWLYTIVFYGVCLVTIYIVTATKRTADARLLLYVILSLNFCVERLVCNYSLPDDHSKVVTEITETVYNRIWVVRQLSIGICIFLLTVFAFKYKDYNVINNTLLQEIKKQNLEIKRSMEIFQVGKRFEYQQRDVIDGIGPIVSSMLSEDTGFQGDEENYSDDDSDSFNSTRTDGTFDPSADWSDDDFNTAENSRDNSGNITPTNKNIDCALECLATNSLSTIEHHPNIVEFSPPLVKRKPGRPRRGERFTPTPDRERYELRSRRSVSRTEVELREETPEEFARIVKSQLGTSRRNFAKWKMAVNKQTPHDYSSDDENVPAPTKL